MLALPEAAGAELLVERMSREPGVELIVAARGDAVVPALVIGIGGIWTEVLGDAAVIPLPGRPPSGSAPRSPRCAVRRCCWAPAASSRSTSARSPPPPRGSARSRSPSGWRCSRSTR